MIIVRIVKEIDNPWRPTIRLPPSIRERIFTGHSGKLFKRLLRSVDMTSAIEVPIVQIALKPSGHLASKTGISLSRIEICNPQWVSKIVTREFWIEVPIRGFCGKQLLFYGRFSRCPSIAIHTLSEIILSQRHQVGEAAWQFSYRNSYSGELHFARWTSFANTSRMTCCLIHHWIQSWLWIFHEEDLGFCPAWKRPNEKNSSRRRLFWVSTLIGNLIWQLVNNSNAYRFLTRRCQKAGHPSVIFCCFNSQCFNPDLLKTTRYLLIWRYGWGPMRQIPVVALSITRYQIGVWT